jgi:hypothetical protein
MSITKETKIEFTLGWFIGTVFSVISFTLTVFMGFYFTVQKPSNDSIKEQMNTQFELRKEYLEEKFEHIDNTISGFSSGLSNLNTQVGELSKQQNNVASANENQGGFN